MKFFQSILIFIVSVTCIHCNSSKKGMGNLNLNSNKSYFQHWSAGLSDGGSGIDVYLNFNSLPDNVLLKEAYFQHMKGSIVQENNQYIAHFKTGGTNSQDIIMSNNPITEMANTPPTNEIFKLPLDINDVGIVYTLNGEEHYTVITDLEERASIALPSLPVENDKGKGQE